MECCEHTFFAVPRGAHSVFEETNEVRRFAVQQTGLAKQKQLRRGCLLCRLRSEITMPDAAGSVQFKKSMLMIGAKLRITNRS